jgi:hypothetical protein
MGAGDGSYPGSAHTPGVSHFYLVMKGVEGISNAEIQKFNRLGVNAGDDYMFVLVDITTDKRLGEDLSKLRGGKALFRRISRSAPVFIFSPRRLTDVQKVKDLQTRTIRNFDLDVKALYRRIGVPERSVRERWVSSLEVLNGFVRLKPGIFGMGLDLNKAVGHWLRSLRRKV